MKKKTDLEEWEEIIPFCIKSIMRLPFSPGLSLGCYTPGCLNLSILDFLSLPFPEFLVSGLLGWVKHCPVRGNPALLPIPRKWFLGLGEAIPVTSIAVAVMTAWQNPVIHHDPEMPRA